MGQVKMNKRQVKIIKKLEDQNHMQNYRKGLSGGWVCCKCGVVQNWEPDPAYPCGCEKLNHSS